MLEDYFIPFVLIIALLGLGTLSSIVFLIFDANEDSLSGMLVQRNRQSSYLMVVCVSMLSMLVSTMVMASAVVRSKELKSNENYMIYCGMFSPIASALILIFPVVVYKTSPQLGSVLNDPPQHSDTVLMVGSGKDFEKIEESKLEVIPLANLVNGHLNLRAAAAALTYDTFLPVTLGAAGVYKYSEEAGALELRRGAPFALFLKSEKTSSFLHYACIFAGILLAAINCFGYVSWKFQKNESVSQNATSITVLILSIIGMLLLLIFITVSLYDTAKRARVVVEAVGLLCIYAAILTISITAGDFNNDAFNCATVNGTSATNTTRLV